MSFTVLELHAGTLTQLLQDYKLALTHQTVATTINLCLNGPSDLDEEDALNELLQLPHLFGKFTVYSIPACSLVKRLFHHDNQFLTTIECRSINADAGDLEVILLAGHPHLINVTFAGWSIFQDLSPSARKTTPLIVENCWPQLQTLELDSWRDDFDGGRMPLCSFLPGFLSAAVPQLRSLVVEGFLLEHPTLPNFLEVIHTKLVHLQMLSLCNCRIFLQSAKAVQNFIRLYRSPLQLSDLYLDHALILCQSYMRRYLIGAVTNAQVHSNELLVLSYSDEKEGVTTQFDNNVKQAMTWALICFGIAYVRAQPSSPVNGVRDLLQDWQAKGFLKDIQHNCMTTKGWSHPLPPPLLPLPQIIKLLDTSLFVRNLVQARVSNETGYGKKVWNPPACIKRGKKRRQMVLAL